MSNLIPSLQQDKSHDWLYLETQNKAVMAEPVKVEEKFPIDIFISDLEKYAKGLPDKESKIYKYAALTTATAHNNRDSNNYFKSFIIFYINSLRETFPDINFDEVEKSLWAVQKDVANSIKHVNIDNTLFLPALLGILKSTL